MAGLSASGLITQIRNRRSTLRRRRPSRQSFNFSESDSDDISDLDIVENVTSPSQEMTTINITPPPPPINIVIPTPPPPPPAVIPVSRPTIVPPPPPISNPFQPSRQLPRTPVRNNRLITTRQNISQLNNNLQLRVNRRNNINGLNFLRR